MLSLDESNLNQAGKYLIDTPQPEGMGIL